MDAELRSRSLDPAGLIPLLAPAMGIGEEAGYQPAAAEGDELYELIDARCGVICWPAWVSAGLVVAEDVQWFDSSTIEMVAALADQADGRVLVVGHEPGPESGYRTVGPSRSSIWRLDRRAGRRAHLGLDSGLVGDGTGGRTRRCDGMPFYLEQVVSGFREAPLTVSVGPGGALRTVVQRDCGHAPTRCRWSRPRRPSGATSIVRCFLRFAYLTTSQVDGVMADLVEARVLRTVGSGRLAVPTRTSPRGGPRIGAAQRAPGPARPGSRHAGRSGGRGSPTGALVAGSL